MSIADNIRQIRAKSGMTQEDFGKIADVSSMAVSQWENGRAVPRMGAVQAISDYFGINKSEIIDDGTDPLPDKARIMSHGKAAYLPVRRLGTVHAGDPTEEMEADDVTMVPEDVALAHPEGFVLRVEGDCMDRRIPEGYDVVVDPTETPRNGSVVVAELEGGEAVMRRWLRGGQTLILAADSHAEHEDIVLRWEDGPVKVLGVVVWSQSPVGAE